MNITNIKSTFLIFLKRARVTGKLLLPCSIVALFGVMCATRDMWINETIKTLTAYSLFISIIALFMGNYFVIENAIELRTNNKQKLFGDYCARFSTNHNICKVAEWLLSIAEFDSNGVLSNVDVKRLNGDKGRTISEPTFFQKKCFGDFLLELNIQIKNKQLEKEDVRKYFSPYATVFKKVLQVENNKACYMWNLSDFQEIL